MKITCTYVVNHRSHRVQKFTTDGKYLLQFGSKGSDNGKLLCPRGLAVHDHKVYVTDCVFQCFKLMVNFTTLLV